METRTFNFTDGIIKHKIKYAEADFGYDYERMLESYGVDKDAIKFLVMVTYINSDEGKKKIPVVDIHAPEEYKKGAVAHEYFCCCNKEYDEPLGIRDDENRCADVEKYVLEHFKGDKKSFIEQRKVMFNTVIDCGLNLNKDAIAKMKKALELLEKQ